MSDEYDATPQEQAQAAIDLAQTVSAEFGWDTECDHGYEAAKRLYNDYGPFELSFGYGRPIPPWYEEPESKS